MDYKETLEYLYSRLPMFTRVGASAYKTDLHNTFVLCNHLGNPQNNFKSIHIGGTNGKGSTSHMLAAVLQKAGYKTGLYTSPHLLDFRERIRINGEMINQEFVVEFTAQTRALLDELMPSFFEVTVAMAFSYFAKHQVDIAIIEVGLGGRLDSTNIITPELSIITNISLDHTNLLGNSIREIAIEKAGIIKQNIPVIISETDNETADIFMSTANEKNSVIFFADQHLKITNKVLEDDALSVSIDKDGINLYEDLALDLTGFYQLKNILAVIKAVELLKQQGYNIAKEHVYDALKNVKGLTGLQGRWHLLGHRPMIICDTGHNEAGIKEVVSNLHRLQYRKLHFVLGMVKDKDITSVLQILPKEAIYYFCSPDLERALPSPDLQYQAKQQQLHGKSYPSVISAFKDAKSNAAEDDLIFVGGSTFVVAEVL